ncbi:MAG: hypothetical protein PVH89_03280 [Gammaproteobacteria bacterium]|jgi:hypothetical protein
MRIVLTKISDQRHTVEIVRSDASRDTIELVTREALFHDLLHYAVESSLPTTRGFWGTLASGKTFADLNDRTGEATQENAETLYRVEGIVGAMTGVARLPVDEGYEKLCWYCETQGQDLPDWVTQAFVAEVSELMRRLLGRWKATPFGESMEIAWAEAAAQ